MRRRDNAATYTRRVLYEERLAVLRSVMAACRSGDDSARLAASDMAHHENDLSENENLLTAELSAIQFSNTLDDAQHAYEVGNQMAGLVAAAASALASSGSAHVDVVAAALIGMISGDENAEEEEQSSSDVDVETQRERCQR